MTVRCILFISSSLWHVAPTDPDEPALARFEFQQPHMGTQFRVVLYARSEGVAQAAGDAAFERIGQLDTILSDYREESELVLLCRQAGGPAVRVSDELFLVLSRSRDLSQRSEGAFDVTAGPIVRLWRRARRLKEMPAPERLEHARSLVGYDKLHLDERTQSVQLLKPGMQLDLGGIAKGYAVDEALERLKQRGITRALVAGSGDIAVGDSPPGEPGWTVGIAPLDSADQLPSQFVLLRDAAVSTSGDAEQFVKLGGKRYSHIVDPRTGMAVVGRSSVTVIAPKGITADALATAASVLGPQRGLKLIEDTEGAAAYIVVATDSGTAAFESSRFAYVPHGRPKHAQSPPQLKGQ